MAESLMKRGKVNPSQVGQHENNTYKNHYIRYQSDNTRCPGVITKATTHSPVHVSAVVHGAGLDGLEDQLVEGGVVHLPQVHIEEALWAGEPSLLHLNTPVR